MSDETRRTVSLARMGAGRFKATNGRGGVLPIGSGDDPDFSPVELLLAALAGCGAIDVGLITGRRAEATRFEVSASGHKVRDHQGNHLTGLRVTLDLEFPDGEAGDAARAVLPRTLEMVHDRLCTVGRTVEIGSPVVYEIGAVTPLTP